MTAASSRRMPQRWRRPRLRTRERAVRRGACSCSNHSPARKLPNASAQSMHEHRTGLVQRLEKGVSGCDWRTQQRSAPRLAQASEVLRISASLSQAETSPNPYHDALGRSVELAFRRPSDIARNRSIPAVGRDWCSCGDLLAGVAQHGPIHVRPDVLATDGAVCGALDGRATLGWHWSDSVAPLANENRGNAEPLGKVRRRPVCRNVCTKVHSPHISAALKPCQALREFTLLALGGLRRRKGGFFAPKI